MQTEKLANQRFLLIFIFSLRLIRRSSGRSETNETDYDANVSETTRGRFLSVVVENHKGFLNAYVSVCKMLWIFHGSILLLGIFLVSQNWRQLEKNHNEDHTEKRFCGINMKAKKTFPLSTKNKSEKYLGKRKGKERKGKEGKTNRKNTLEKGKTQKGLQERFGTRWVTHCCKLWACALSQTELVSIAR